MVLRDMVQEPRLRQIVGNQIRRRRALLRISQQDLANLSGLHRSYIGGVERGERNLGIDNLEKIALAMRVEPWKLLHE